MTDEQEQLPADPPAPAPAPGSDPDLAAAAGAAAGRGSVTRSVDLQASPEAVWEALVDPESRGAWLDDEDALARALRIERADTGRSLTWTWWRPDDEAGASQVHVELTPLTDGSTRVAVTERLLTPPGTGLRPTLRARAAATGTATTGVAALWDYRLLGLELLVVAAGAFVL